MSRSRMALPVVALLLLGSLSAGSRALGSAVNSPAAAPRAVSGHIVEVGYTATAPAARLAQVAATATGAAAPSEGPATAQPLTIQVQPGANDQSQILEAVYQKVNPSVVEVVTLSQGRSRLGQGVGMLPQGEGSGFLWDGQGHIVTNDHVVSGADQLQVVFADGT